MVPVGDRITSGDPAFAQAVAHSPLMGFFSPLVKAQAESRTYPFTVTVLAASPTAKAATASNSGTANLMCNFIWNFLRCVHKSFEVRVGFLSSLRDSRSSCFPPKAYALG